MDALPRAGKERIMEVRSQAQAHLYYHLSASSVSMCKLVMQVFTWLAWSKLHHLWQYFCILNVLRVCMYNRWLVVIVVPHFTRYNVFSPQADNTIHSLLPTTAPIILASPLSGSHCQSANVQHFSTILNITTISKYSAFFNNLKHYKNHQTFSIFQQS